jgi:hypothetical protein
LLAASTLIVPTPAGSAAAKLRALAGLKAVLILIEAKFDDLKEQQRYLKD